MRRLAFHRGECCLANLPSLVYMGHTLDVAGAPVYHGPSPPEPFTGWREGSEVLFSKL